MPDYTPTLIPLPTAAPGGMTSTPETLRAQREYAKALLYGKGQQPVQHWTQGVSNMVSALVGGMMDRKANQQENEANAVEGSNLVPNTGDTSAPGPMSGVKSMSADVGGGDDIERSAIAIAKAETGNERDPYNAIGPVVKKGAYAGDQAHGKYQVMGLNVPVWTKEVFGRSMTPAEFRANPDAQEKLFRAKFKSPTQWFGKGHDDGYTTGDTYRANYARNMGMPSSATAFAGAPSKAASPAAAVMGSALRNEPSTASEPPEAEVQMAGGPKPLARPTMGPDGSGMFYDPALIRRPPQYTREQMLGIQGSPRISDAQKAQALQQYQMQGQPIELPWPGGVVRIDPNNPRRQQFIPKEHWGKSELGDMKTDQMLVPDGRGGVRQVIPSQTPGPRSDAGPVPGATPAVAPAGGPPAPVMAENASAAPVGPSEATVGVAPAAAPVKVASLDPAAGVSTAAAGTGVVPEATPVAAPKPAAPLQSFAQATPPGATPEQLKLHGFSDQQIEDYTRKKAYDNAQTLAQEKGKADIGVTAEAQKKSNELSVKRYEEMLGRVESATEQRKNVSTARAQMADANFYAGLGAGLQENWRQLKVSLGIDPNAAAPMEIFRKTTAQSIMSGLKTAFGGLGQIRVAEIELQKVANASTNNSPAAIRALLEITDRNAALVQDLGEMTTAYKSGAAVMDPRDPTKMLFPANLGPDGEPMERNGVDAKFDRIAQKYAKEHPTFTEKEYKEFHDIMKAPGEQPKAAPPKVGDIQEFDAPGGGKVQGVWDGKKWGPKK